MPKNYSIQKMCCENNKVENYWSGSFLLSSVRTSYYLDKGVGGRGRKQLTEREQKCFMVSALPADQPVHTSCSGCTPLNSPGRAPINRLIVTQKFSYFRKRLIHHYANWLLSQSSWWETTSIRIFWGAFPFVDSLCIYSFPIYFLHWPLCSWILNIQSIVGSF